MMREAARSLTDPPGLYHSALPRISRSGKPLVIRSSRSSGVLPMRSRGFNPRRAELCGVLVSNDWPTSAGLKETCAIVDKAAVTIVMCRNRQKEESLRAFDYRGCGQDPRKFSLRTLSSVTASNPPVVEKGLIPGNGNEA